MKEWLVWAAILVWLAVHYAIGHITAVSVIPAIRSIGVIKVAVVLFLLNAVWNTVLYLLLCSEERIGKFQKQLIRLRRAQERSVPVRIRRWLRHCPKEPLLSPGWIVALFIIGGPILGVPALRLALPNGVGWRALLFVGLGTAANIVFWVVLVSGSLASLVGVCIKFLLGGG
jgi:hypothetical protein